MRNTVKLLSHKHKLMCCMFMHVTSEFSFVRASLLSNCESAQRKGALTIHSKEINILVFSLQSQTRAAMHRQEQYSG